MAKISDYDPKQWGKYYNRFYYADFSKFNLDEECKSINLVLLACIYVPSLPAIEL